MSRSKQDVWQALENALPIRAISAPDRTRFGVLEDGFESLIHDRKQLDTQAGTFLLVAVNPLLVAAGVLGDAVNYHIGYRVGPTVF